jgi:hypothetical protein
LRWEDEPWVKLYARDTPTWRAMCWQGRAVLPLLLRVLDKAGLLECGELGRSAVSLMISVPPDVVDVGLAELERLGVVVWHEPSGVLEMPNFEEAQEAKTSDLVRKREQRKRDKDRARAQTLTNTQLVSRGVTRGHAVSHGVTPRQPSPAQTEKIAGENPPAPKKQKAPKEQKPPDPRHAPLRAAMRAAYREERGADLGWEGKEAGILSGLLAANPTLTAEDGAAAWRRALRHSGYPTVSTVAEFRQHLAHFLGAGPPMRAGGARAGDLFRQEPTCKAI